MAASAGDEWDRDLILANFQAASGVEDLQACITILEVNNWDLQASLNTVFSDDRNEGVEIVENPPSSRQAAAPVDFTSKRRSSPQVIDVDSPQNEPRLLIFQILWEDLTVPITIKEDETVGELKRLIEQQTGRTLNGANLEGWPSAESAIADQTILSTLELNPETTLVIPTRGKVTTTLPEFQACNKPSIFNGAVGAAGPSTRNFNIKSHEESFPFSGSSGNNILLVIHHGSREYQVTFDIQQTVREVKKELERLTDIRINQQNWRGWCGANDDDKLKDLGLPEAHSLILSRKADDDELMEIPNPSEEQTRPTAARRLDDFDDAVVYDDDDLEEFSEPPEPTQVTALLSRNAQDDTDTMLKLQDNFQKRFGEFHPAFFMGPLKDGIDEASGEKVEDRKPLLVYLHHDKSLYCNVFCSEILCAMEFVTYVSHNFVIWPWDVTEDSNKRNFVGLMIQHFGNNASTTIAQYEVKEYPLLLVITKSQAGLEICSVLKGMATLEELMPNLINAYEVFEQTKLVEVRQERERRAREAVKQEQDYAYQASLAADKAKQYEEEQKEQQELKRIEECKLQEQIKEAERISCIEHVAEEPPKGAENITTIRFRYPNGDTENRRFYGAEHLKFTEDDQSKTLKELNLTRQVQLFVEEI